MKVINIVATIYERNMRIDLFSKVEAVKILTAIVSKFGDEVEQDMEDMFQTF
jgi:hypothetical protein